MQSFVFIERGRRVFPIKGFVKIDKDPILSRQVENGDFTLVMDPTLAEKGYKEGSVVLFNSPEKLAFPQLKNRKIKTYYVDATGISLAILKANMPNTAMLGALAKQFNKVSIKNIKTAMEEMQKDNLAAFDEGYKTVR